MRFVTCRLPDGVEDPAILSQDGTQVWPLSWLGLSYETLSDAIPFLTPQVRFGLQLAISGIPALPPVPVGAYLYKGNGDCSVYFPVCRYV